jgi:hypothetical protein
MQVPRLFLAAVLVIVACVTSMAGVRAQDRPLQADGIVRLLLDLESAIASARVEEFRAIATPSISAEAVARFEAAARGGENARAIVRERTRRADGRVFDVIVDVLVSRDDTGRIASWHVRAAPGETAGQYRIDDLRELAAVDGLLKLRMDSSRQFAVKDLVVNAPDLTFRMASGTAFVAESPNGITALVLRGKGEITFAPKDPAEQVQLRIFAGKPSFTAQVDSAFLRLNPAEYVLRVSDKSLTPTRVIPSDLARARELFDEISPKTYNVDLRNLTSERWSLEPTYGNLVLEVRTNRYGWLTYARSPSDHEDISFFDREHHRNISLYMSDDVRARRGRTYSEDDGAAFDIEHYRLNLSFDPARLWVSGRASVQVRILASSIASINLKLAQPLEVASVSSPTLGDLLSLRIVGQSTVLVGLPSFVERGSVILLDVVYGGRLENQPLDREAIAPQGQRGGESEPLVLTPEKRYLYSNRAAWYPQGGTSDYATAEIRVSVPSEYQLVATGTLVRSSVVPAKDPLRSGSKSLRVVEYLADRPVRYLALVISRLIAIGRLQADVPSVSPPTVTRAGAPSPASDLTVDVVSTSRMTGQNRQTPQRVSAMLTSFATLLGDAPYPDFTLAAFDELLPGGHSPAYFAVFNQPLPTSPYSWAADPVAFDDVYRHFFLAHEVAHQWWGQAVGWKNYHEQWLSEGLAQYFAALYAAEDRGQPMLEQLIAGMRASAEPYFDQGPISLGYRLGHIRSDGRVFRALVYNKSAVVLQMLRRMIGDEAFLGGLRRFYSTWRFKKAGTEDFQAALQAGTSMKLDRFFDRWFRGFNRPRIRVVWHNGQDGRSAAVRVEQTTDVFDFPLTVLVQFEDGRTETRTIKVTDLVTEDRLAVTSPIRRVTVRDPMSIFELVR